MRKVTLKRKFSIIECASKIVLLVQCADEDAEVDVNKIPCKVLGKLKNGKTVEFEIGNEETNVFIESSTMLASYAIPAGTENVSLVAYPKYNLAEGNPFTIKQVQ